MLAAVLGSAVRQDGRSASLTAPNGQAQQGLLVASLADAGVAAAALALHEAHGTGTALGDPIEAGSLAAAVLTEREAPLPVGGVKANIGHAEPAAVEDTNNGEIYKTTINTIISSIRRICGSRYCLLC